MVDSQGAHVPFLAFLCGLFLLSPILIQAQDNPATSEAVVSRYKQMLERKPREGNTFDRVYQSYLEGAGLDAMLADYEALARAQADNPNPQLILGHICKRLGRDSQALQAYNRAVQLAPDDHYPRFVLGLMHAVQRDHQQAIAELSRAEELAREADRANPDDLMAIYRALGRAYFHRDQLDDAVSAWQKIAELDPTNIFSRLELADLFREQELYEQAIAQHEAIIQVKQDDPYRVCLSQREIGKLQERMGEYEQAIQTYNSAILLTAPGNWLRRDMQQRISGIYIHNGDFAGLIEYYQGKLQETPNDVELLGLLAGSLAENEQIDESIAQYRKAIELAPTDESFRLRLISVLRDSDQLSEAADEYEQLVEQQPDEVGLYRELGKLYVQLEQPDQARATYQRVAERWPEDANIRLTLAEIYASEDWIEDAVREYERAISLAPGNPDYIEYFGEFYFHQGNRDETVETWNRLVAGENATAENYARMARLLDAKEFRAEAIDASQRAIELAPEAYQHRVDLAKRLADAGKHEGALAEYEHAAQLAPNPFFAEQMRDQQIDIYRRQGTLAEQITKLEALPERGFADQMRLAKMVIKLGNISHAVEILNKARELEPSDVALNRLLIELHERQGRQEQALKLYQHLINVDASNTREYYTDMARLHLRVLDLEAATESAKQVIAHAPRNPEGHQLLAEIAEATGDYETAIHSLKQALRLRPEAVKIRAQLAQVYRNTGSPRQAIEQYWRCWEDSSSVGEKQGFVQMLVDVYYDMDRSSELEGRLRQLVRTSTSDLAPVLALAELYRTEGDLPASRDQLARALEEQPQDADLLSELAKVNVELGDTEVALKYQQRLVKAQPDPSNRRRLGEMLFDLGREQEAIQAWSKLVHARNQPVDAEVKLAGLLIRYGLLDDALSALDRAADQVTDAQTLYEIGAAFVEMNEFGRAIPHFEQVLEMPEPPQTGQASQPTLGSRYGPPGMTGMARFELPRNLSHQIQQRRPGPTGQIWTPSSFEEAQAGALVQLTTIAQQQGTLPDFIAGYEARVDQHPSDVHALEQLLKVYLLTQDNTKVQETIKHLVTLSPQDPDYQALQLTHAMHDMSSVDELMQFLEQISQIAPEARPWFAGKVIGQLHRQGKMAEAEELIAEIEQAKVTDLTIGAMLVEVLTQIGKPEVAETILAGIPVPAAPVSRGTASASSAGQLWQLYVQTHQSLAIAYLVQGNLEKGLDRFWSFLSQTQPSNPNRPTALGHASYSYGGYRPVSSGFPSANSYYDEQRLRFLQQVFLQLWGQEQQKALYAYLQSKFDQSSEVDRIYPGLALSYCYWWEGKRSEAQQVLMLVQSDSPRDLTLRLNTALVSIQTGDYQQAMELLEKVAESDPRNRSQYRELQLQLAAHTGNTLKVRELVKAVLRSPAGARELYQFSQKLHQSGLTAQAIPVAKKAMKLAMGQRDPNFLAELSQHLEQLGRGHDAAALAARALRFAGQRDRYGRTMSSYRYQQVANLTRHTQVRKSEREDTLAAAAEKNPQSFQAQVRLASHYQTTNQIDKAAVAFDKALALRPKDSTTRQRYAEMMMRGGHPQDAVEQYALLLKDNPSVLGHNYWEVINTFFNAGKAAELVELAKTAIGPAVGRNYGNDFARQVASRAVENNFAKEGAELYEAILNAQPSNTYLIPQLASAYAAAGEREKASQLIRHKLDSETSSDPGTRTQLALKLLEFARADGTVDELVAEYEGQLAEQPDEPALLYLVASMKLAAGDREGAEPLVAQLVELPQATDSGWITNLANAYRSAGDPEGEIRLLEQALQRNTRFDSYRTEQNYEALASVLARKGDKQRARELFRKMAAMRLARYRGSSSYAKRDLAETFMRHEMWDDAEAYYTDLLNDLSSQQYEREQAQRQLMEIQRRRDGLDTTTQIAEKTEAMPIGAQRALAQQYLRNNDLVKASELFEKIVQAMPEDFESHAQLAETYSRQTKHEESIKIWQKLLETDPENTRFQDGLVNAYQAADQISEALELARKYVEQEPSSVHYGRLARVYAAGDRVAGAFQAYEKALELSPGNAEMHKEVARLQQRTGNLDAAEQSYQEALKYTSQDWERRDIERELMNLYRQQGKLEEMFEKAEADGTLTFEMQRERAQGYRNEGDLEKALAAYKSALDMTSQRGDQDRISRELLQLHVQLDQQEEALKLYGTLSQGNSGGTSIMYSSSGIQISFGNDQARRTLVDAYQRQNALPSLAVHFEQQLAEDAKNPQALETLGDIHRAQSTHVKAAETYQRLSEVQPGNVRSFYYAAQQFALAEQPEIAQKMLDQGRAMLSGHNRSRDRWFLAALGTICLDGKLYEPAIKLFEDAITDSRYGGYEQESFHRMLAQSYRGLERYEEAVRAYQQMANVARNDSGRQEALNAMRETYKEGGLLPKVLEERRQKVADSPDDPDAHFALAQAHEWDDQFEEATAVYQRLMELQPESARWPRTIGDIYRKPTVKELVDEQVLSLDGDGDFVEIVPSAVLDDIGPQVTMEAWIKPSMSHEWTPIITKAEERTEILSNRSYTLWLNGAGFLHLAGSPGNAEQTMLDSPRLIWNDMWHHVAGVIDTVNRSMQIFIDGEQVARTSFADRIHVGALPLRIGWVHEKYNYHHFRGEIDEVRIWRTARSGTEIRATMHTKLTGTEPGLVGYWSFDGENPETVQDFSPEGNTGQLIGDAKKITVQKPVMTPASPEALAKAVQSYAKAVELDPTSYQAYQLLGNTHRQIEQISEAEATYLRALGAELEQQDHDTALRDLWSLYTETESVETGLARFEELAPKMPQNQTLIYELLGQGYEQLGEQEKADVAYTQWLELRLKEVERNGRAYDFRNLAEQLLDKERMPEKALELAKRAAVQYSDPSYLSILGRAYLVNGNYEQAGVEILRALKGWSATRTGSEDPMRMLWSNIIKAGSQVQDAERFLQFVTEMGEAMPDNPITQLHMHLALAAYHEEQGENEAANEHLNKTGFISERAWWVLGPFDNTGGIAYNNAYIQEEAETIQSEVTYQGRTGAIQWQQLRDDVFDGFVDMGGIFGENADWVAAYAWTTISVPTERAAQFLIGSDDQCKIWLNGEEIFTNAGARPAKMDQDKVPTTLQAGENTILVKVCDEQQFWGFYLRIADAVGKPFNDLKLH